MCLANRLIMKSVGYRSQAQLPLIRKGKNRAEGTEDRLSFD